LGTWIELPYGAPGDGFDADELVAHIARSGRDYIIMGGANCVLEKHPKPNSLDVWLRKGYTTRKGTRQSVVELRRDLVATGLFVEQSGLRCPDSGRACRGLQLTAKGKELAGRLGG
jgi:hypothetical protein